VNNGYSRTDSPCAATGKPICHFRAPPRGDSRDDRNGFTKTGTDSRGDTSGFTKTGPDSRGDTSGLKKTGTDSRGDTSGFTKTGTDSSRNVNSVDLRPQANYND
jgi:hypothetical protein